MPSQTSHHLPFPCIGTQRTLDVFTYGDPHAARCVYIQAALHADELPGATPHMQQQVDARVMPLSQACGSRSSCVAGCCSWSAGACQWG
jgi:hypothetical protein